MFSYVGNFFLYKKSIPTSTPTAVFLIAFSDTN